MIGFRTAVLVHHLCNSRFADYAVSDPQTPRYSTQNLSNQRERRGGAIHKQQAQ